MSGTWRTAGGIGYVEPMLYPLADMDRVYRAMAPLKPHFWRAMAPINYMMKAREPGAAVANPPSYGTAPYVFTPPTTANRDWSRTDRFVNEIMRIVGADIILIIGSLGGARPKFHATSGGGLFNLGGLMSQLAGSTGSTSKFTADDFGTICGEIADRYKPGGVGIAPDLAGKGITHFEIWNEQNSAGFWGRSVDAAEYTTYLQAAYNAIKAVPGLSGSASTVIFGGTQHIHRSSSPSILNGWMTQAEVEFIGEAYDAGAQGYFDWMACHTYTTQDAHASGLAPDPADDAWLQFDEIRALMLDRGDDKPVLISEIGYPVSMCTEQQQADYTATAMSYWQARPWCCGYINYNARDSGKQNTRNDTLGILRWDFTPRLPLFNYLLSLSPVEAAFTAGVTASMSMAGAIGARPVTLGVTASMSMAAAARYAAAFTAAVTASMSMAATEKYAAAVNLGVTASMSMAGGLSGTSQFTAGVTASMSMAASQTAQFTLGVTASMSMAAAERYARAFTLGVTASMSMTGVGQAPPAFTAAVTASMSMAAKMSYDFTFSGTTKPAGMVDVGSQIVSAGTNDLANSFVASGILQEGATNGTTNGTFWLIVLWPDPTATELQDVLTTVGNLTTNNAQRGQGVACAFDAAGTNGVFMIGVGGSGGAFAEAIFSKVGTTITQEASITTGLLSSTDVPEIRVSVSAGVYTYTVYKGGVATGLSWTDSAHKITPGKYWGGAFQHTRASGVQGESRGLTRYRAFDL